jgi:hypothetical protein
MEKSSNTVWHSVTVKRNDQYELKKHKSVVV